MDGIDSTELLGVGDNVDSVDVIYDVIYDV